MTTWEEFEASAPTWEEIERACKAGELCSFTALEDISAYQALTHLFGRYTDGKVTKERARAEKNLIRTAWGNARKAHKAAFEAKKRQAELFKAQESAMSEFRRSPCRDTAWALYNLFEYGDANKIWRESFPWEEDEEE